MLLRLNAVVSINSSHFYEMALVGPDMPNAVPPVYGPGYSDQADAIGSDGCVPMPHGPGLGVTYDWGFIERNAETKFVAGRT